MITAAKDSSPSKLKAAWIASGLLVVAAGTALSPAPVFAQDAQGYAGNVIGGVAGALLGSRVGNGNGRIAAAAVGGVVGSIVGGNVQAGMQQPQPYPAPVVQRQVVQQPVYTYETSHPVVSQPYGYEAYPAIPQQPRYEPVYPQQRVVRYEQPTYVQQSAPVVYQQPAPVEQRGYTGPIVGGVTGALLASRVGKGNGKIAATALGGVVGAVVGDRIQNAPAPVQQGYVQQPAQQYSQPVQTVNRASYYNDSYGQRRYATPDPY